MTEKLQPESTPAMAGDVETAHRGWVEAAGEAKRALHAWLDGAGRDQRSLYVVYRAALDREEAAARELERLSGAGFGGRLVPATHWIGSHTYGTPIVREMPRPGLGA